MNDREDDGKILSCVYALFTSTKLGCKIHLQRYFVSNVKNVVKINFQRMTRNSEDTLSLSDMLRNNLWIRRFFQCGLYRVFHTEAKRTTFSQDFCATRGILRRNTHGPNRPHKSFAPLLAALLHVLCNAHLRTPLSILITWEWCTYIRRE